MDIDTLIHYIAYPQEVKGLDIILPFLLIFAVLYLGLSRMKAFKKNISIVLALCISLLVIITHLKEGFSPCYDLVVIINNAMPQFGLVVLALISFVFIIAAIGIKEIKGPLMGLAAAGAIGVIIYIFFSSTSGYYRELCPKPEWTAAIGEWIPYLIGIAVFILIAKYVFKKTNP